MNSEQIAASVGTNASYIRKLSTRLRKARIIEAHRGISGFVLSKKPEDISLFEIYRAVMQVQRMSIFDIHQNPNDECVVGNHIKPVLSGMFRNMEEQLKRSLSDISLNDCIKELENQINKENQIYKENRINKKESGNESGDINSL